MAASSFTSVSLDPPFVLVCIANSSTTWPRMRRSPAVGISVLSEEHDTVCRSLAGAASERFRGIPWEESAGGAVFIPGAAARLDCAVEREIPAGDHHIVLLRVHAAAIDTQAAPLVFHASGFRQLQSAGVG
jgi:flavin reductase (DIM6/NTAB) family NADH-FMN oxidoreductase RutF